MGADTYDFGGYATRNDIRCTDGRIIRKNAFIGNDGTTVPLVWQHNHDSPENVLGHGLLENRDDGVYVYGKFNNTKMGQEAKEIVQHGDITRLSIYANRLKEDNHNVVHGEIKEVSLVYAGANDGAYIDTISFSHADGSIVDEVIIYSGEDFSLDVSHADEKETTKVAETKTEDSKERTVQDVIDSMNEEQKNVLYYLVGNALDGGSDDDTDTNDEEDNSDDKVKHGDDDMKWNVFEGKDENTESLSHMEALKADTPAIFADAKRCGSLKESFLAHAQEAATNGKPGVDYGIKDLELFFPDYKMVPGEPNLISRDMEWVSTILNGVSKTPFSRIKSVNIDVTAKEARAMGYKKGTFKKEEVVLAAKRTTDPTTIYKKQKLDRDDILDMTNWGAVAFLKTEMRTMLNEEVARAILIGDGRAYLDQDKIPADKIRPIYYDERLYSIKVPLAKKKDDETEEALAMRFIDTVIRNRKKYKGSGNPTFYTSEDFLSTLLLVKDADGHYMYKSESELATVLRVSKIVTVPVMEDAAREIETNEATKYEGYTANKVYKLLGIIVNPKDYYVGHDRGGEITFFDDFDIDYNQQKYLMETRLSGALVKPYSAMVFELETDKDSPSFSAAG